MSDKLIPFLSDRFGEVRVWKDANGDPWFSGVDVCRALELNNPRTSLALLDEDEKGVHTVDTLGGPQQTVFVSEPGLYTLVLRSRKPEAREFRRWITHEVIPAIRKHGGYLTPKKIEEILLNPDTIIKLATDLKTERAARLRLETKVTEDAPKVHFHDAVAASGIEVELGEVAQLIRNTGAPMGRNRLMRILREDGLLVSQKGPRYNLPTQKAAERGLLMERLIPRRNRYGRVLLDSRGNEIFDRAAMATPKGLRYFIARYGKPQALPPAGNLFDRLRLVK
jgi:anti-repressor protein